MTSEEWKEKIENACKDAGTYQPYFQSAIETLANIMEMRDDAQYKFNRSGGNTVVKHTNKAGATNYVKNPALVAVLELNTQALSYWRDLGLTPKGYRAVQEIADKPNAKAGSVESILGAPLWKRK